MSRETLIPDRLESALTTISGLSKIVIDNEGFKGSDGMPQLDSIDVDAVMRAILLISAQAHDDFCEIMNSKEACR
ncbi:hypothetical protein [Pseudomonas asplenii]|uniref:Uncharacterized protein n=1 Tax=Pseudomonas asplenii TaxID=53407 RepID=A0A1H6P2C3_9PSED|nr:hypothetical protein [Pseudomonas fuscovaginae]SEI23639.1 hypothetical protein SAMN05216581_5249 [Pseudomonas fuscovaginae]